jgi:ligand-binding sensor domain-containing protein/serine phosphatase RsbU (regulator of sigma subunit)
MPGFLIKKITLFTLFLVMLSLFAQAQQFPFRNLGLEEGIPHAYVNTINQDPSGFIWIGTVTDLARFNGFEFESNPAGDSLPADFASISFTDSRGRIWFGHNTGSISVLENKRIRVLDNMGVKTTITGFAEDHRGNILIASQQHGLLVADPEMNVTLYRESFSSLTLTSIAVADENKFLIGSFEGLYSFTWTPGTAPELSERINSVPQVTIECLHSFGERGVFAGTRDRGLFYLKKEDDGSYRVTNTGQKYGFGNTRVQSVLLDDQEDLWVSTWGHGVYKISGFFSQESGIRVKNFSMVSGLASNFVRGVFQDSEGNHWFTTINGLSLLTTQALSFYRSFEEPFGRDVYAVFSDDVYIWLGGESGMLRIKKDEPESTVFYGTQRGLPFDRITALATCSDGHLWIGTGSSGLYRLRKGEEKAESYHISDNSPENSINDLSYSRGTLVAATNNGVYEFNLKTGINNRYTTYEGLPHNFIRGIHTDNDGLHWIATRSNRLIDINNTRELRVAGSELEFISITQDHHGRLWAATTSGNGILMVTNDTIVNLTASEGLHSNFCYSLITDDEGYIWVGHRLGISRVDPESFFIRTYGFESGIRSDFNPNAVHKSPDGTLLFGTTGGLVSFDPSMDKRIAPSPRLNITSLLVSDEEYPGVDRIILPYGSYKLRIDFIGLNYSSPEKVKYQYKLDGYDIDWSDISGQRYAYYSRVDDGNFVFLLRAFNAEGVISETPLSLAISVDRPLWKKWYFFVFCAVIAGLLFLLIIKIRERNLRLEKERIEKELIIRTKEVLEQKREIEHKNRDITDSINYAQRIQASILPPVSRIENNFAESFVFYQPRDIVSGDFYWFDKVNESKFLIVCADSTGHGVPGAFMSMIGTTLIKDICMRPEIGSPSEILETLDREITSTLNQNVDSIITSNDGMDITVCEFDTKKLFLRFASAMRPIMILHKDELIYIRGSRNSIGGYVTHEKAFENQGYQLQPGDIVYLFSDGYPDQFGGPLGKKFKMVRLRNLLTDICHRSMKEQYDHVSNNFNLWKGDYEQVDDVLFMGIKV